MKKTLLTLAFCCVLTLSAQSSKREEGIKFGIKGGLNVTNFMGDIVDNGIRTSVHLGVIAEIMVSNAFSLQPELLYSGQGATYIGANPGFSRTKIDYITMPLLGKFYVTNALSVETGPQLGILVSAKNKTNYSNDTIEGIKTFDFGLNLGLEYDLKNNVFFQTRYTLGLTNNGYTGDDNKRTSNTAFQFSVGYQF